MEKITITEFLTKAEKDKTLTKKLEEIKDREDAITRLQEIAAEQGYEIIEDECMVALDDNELEDVSGGIDRSLRLTLTKWFLSKLVGSPNKK